MTTLNPTHIPGLSKKPRTGQAVHHDAESSDQPPSFPDDLEHMDDSAAEMKARWEGKQRVRKVVPPLPDLRFEQSYLLSIRPFLTPVPTSQRVEERGSAPAEQNASKSLVGNADDDAVFHWGRQMMVNWQMVSWVTFRDHFISPLMQGMFWGVAMPGLSAASVFFRQALYPASHVSKGRVVGGSGGSIKEAGGGSVIGDVTGYWKKWVSSFGGAVETAAA